MRNTMRTTTTMAGVIGGALLLVGGQAIAGTTTEPEAPKGNAACTAEDIEVDLNPQPGRPADYLLALTNTSDATCEFSGTFGLTPQNMAGEPIDQVPHDAVDHPGAPAPITLAPDRTAFAGVQFDLGDKADSDTYVASGFTATLPEVDGEIQAEVVGTDGELVQIPLTGLRVGTLQPSANGVLF
ncbi:DUF4232 domain-containing protein [Actinoalloteichus hymeniacidonis]|uniref:DUF4232 family protein n=1 Tax=Actinoalloteichus hymeniacidonis TaxID=340345 RepID=A0AAC9N064_9PSEU|nr:DUF4232 domain-containing protein [Actinoalloteichus hymeniacidonis]AOS65219.1 putative DUF4232 family protein [Actinoalloteichus hymeniacidonis]MBB5906701.1 hypothetical protein [Actinoalloteichus hymeniacidonis]